MASRVLSAAVMAESLRPSIVDADQMKCALCAYEGIMYLTEPLSAL